MKTYKYGFMEKRLFAFAIQCNVFGFKEYVPEKVLQTMVFISKNELITPFYES